MASSRHCNNEDEDEKCFTDLIPCAMEEPTRDNNKTSFPKFVVSNAVLQEAIARNPSKEPRRTVESLLMPSIDHMLCRPRSYSYSEEPSFIGRTFAFPEEHSLLFKEEEQGGTVDRHGDKEQEEVETSFVDSESGSLTTAMLKQVRNKKSTKNSTGNEHHQVKSLSFPAKTTCHTPPKTPPSHPHFTRKNSLVDHDDQANKWAPVKTRPQSALRRRHDLSPLRTKLGNRFKSQMEPPLHDSSYSFEEQPSTPHYYEQQHNHKVSCNHKVSPLRIKLENKFKSSPLKASRRSMVEDNQTVQQTSPICQDMLCAPVVEHSWEQAPKHDATLETLLATVDESILEMADVSILESTGASILANDSLFLCDQSFIEEGIEQELSISCIAPSFMEEGIEQELSISCIAPNETDIHEVAESEEPVWSERSNSWEASLDGSFLKETVSPLAEETLAEEKEKDEAVSQLAEETSAEEEKDETLVKEDGSEKENKLEEQEHTPENPQDTNDSRSQQKGDYQVGAVLRNMNKFPNRKVFQQHGMKVLMEATDENPHVAGAIARRKGIPIILAAMKRYPFERMLQWRALRTLSVLSNVKANAEALVMKHAGMSIIIGNLSEHYSKDAEIVIAACNLLARLGRLDELKKPIDDVKAVKLLLAVFNDFEGNDEVEEAARGAMKSLL